jgi:hypothetical protein
MCYDACNLLSGTLPCSTGLFASQKIAQLQKSLICPHWLMLGLLRSQLFLRAFFIFGPIIFLATGAAF